MNRLLIERSDLKKKMGIGERLATIKAAFTGVPNQSLISMAKAFMPILGEPPRRSAQEWLELYNKSPRMGSIHLIASHIGSATYGIYNNNDPKKIKIRNHAMEQLFKKPNEDITMTEFTLFYLTEAYLLLPSGECFWLKERNGLGKVTQLWVIPPHWLSEIPSRAKPYFTVQPLGNMQSQPIYVPPFDMVYFKRPDVTNPYLRGVGKAENIGDELETDEYMAKFSKRYFFNGAIPDMVGFMPGADESTINRTDEVWNQKYGGFNNAHKTAWLNFDAKFQILKETNKDLEYINSRKFLSDSVRQFFNIPPELFGDVSNSNRSTIDSAFYLFAKNCLRNELTFICDVINRQLTPEFSDDIYFEHDEIVPEDSELKFKQASEGLKNGGLLVDEWRMANGFEPLPNGKGQILYVPLNMIPVPLSDKAIQVNMEPQQAELPKIMKNVAEELKQVKQVIKSLTKKEKTELGPRYFYDDAQYRYVEIEADKPIAFIENRSIGKKGHFNVAVHSEHRGKGIAKKIVEKAIDAAKETDLEKIYWITAAENKGSISLAKKCGFEYHDEDSDDESVRYVYYLIKKKMIKKSLDSERKKHMWLILDKAAVKNERLFINSLEKYFQDQQDKINQSLSKSVKQATNEPDELLDWDEEEIVLLGILTPLWLASLKEGFETVNVMFSFGLTEDFMQPKFLEWIDQFGANQVKEINDTTKDKLRKTLSEGIAEGESIPRLRNRVSQVMTEAKTSRAEKISRTETHSTVVSGTFETYKSAGVKQKEWLSTKDNRVRDSHAAIDGEIVGIDEPFSNGLMQPGDPNGAPEEIINCRCDLLPIIPE